MLKNDILAENQKFKRRKSESQPHKKNALTMMITIDKNSLVIKK